MTTRSLTACPAGRSGWYTGTKTGSRCDDCVLYKSCGARRDSVCKDVDNPRVYRKNPQDTVRVPTPEEVKGYEVAVTLTDKYCKGSEILTIEKATEKECKSNCSSFSDCWYVAYYSNSEPDEDAKVSSCTAQCRLFSSCRNSVHSLCKPGPTVFVATTTTTTTSTTTIAASLFSSWA